MSYECILITDRFKTIGTGKYNFKAFHTPPTDQFLEKKKKRRNSILVTCGSEGVNVLKLVTEVEVNSGGHLPSHKAAR